MNVTTAERLREYMEHTGDRQIDVLRKVEPIAVSKGIKLSKADINKYFSGAVVPKTDKLFLLADALGVSAAWLAGYDVPMSQTAETVSAHEWELLHAYRQHPDAQPFVDKLLDLPARR